MGRAVPQLLWPDKDREGWFSLGENHKKVFRSVEKITIEQDLSRVEKTADPSTSLRSGRDDKSSPHFSPGVRLVMPEG
jgi:hypothetical protein